MKKNVITRRDFLKTTSSAALAGALVMSSSGKSGADTARTSRVVLIRDNDVLDDSNNISSEIMQKMLDDAVTTLLDESDPVQAWKRLVKPNDIVGIKTNVWNYLPTPAELEQAIEKRVIDAGVPPENIGTRDRGLYDDEIFKKATALINTRPMRTHHWSGVGSLLKNYITFSPSPASYHGDTCADLARLWELPLAKGKTRLNVLVMMTPLFHSVGPHAYNPEFTWPYKGLIVGTDPVAVDATGVRILLAKRREHFGEERPINPPPKHVFLADTRHGLGVADPDRIDLVKIGWQDGVLI
jgi:hypothetical protein